MALKETVKNLKSLLEEVCGDLDKADGGNKAASQRVRTGTIRLEKLAKLYRKESIHSERGGGGKKAKKAPSKTSSKASSKSASKAKPAKKAAPMAKKKATAKIVKKKKR